MVFLSGNYARGTPAVVAKFHAFVADSRAVSLWQLGFSRSLLSFRPAIESRVEWANRWRAAGAARDSAGAVAYSLATGDVARGLRFAFAPDLSRLTSVVVLAPSARHSFAMGVSAGIIIAYGAYMPVGESLQRSVVAVVGSIFAAIAARNRGDLPLMFHYGLNPARVRNWSFRFCR